MKNLIEKYFAGDTSKAEEDQLKAYFNSGQVEESLAEYIPLFQFLNEGKEPELSADFDEKLFDKIDNLETGMAELLEKYFAGETSIEEETRLKAYFNSGQVEESLKKHIPLFQFLDNEKKLELSADFDEKLFDKIDNLETGMAELLEKYFAGETSIEEETRLKAYFNGGQVDPALQQYQPLFQYFNQEQAVQLSEDFDAKLFRKMDGGAKIVQMRSWRRRMLRVAAAIAVMLCAYLVFQKPEPPQNHKIDWAAYEINDEQMAYEETVRALKLLSSKLNKGKKRTINEVVKTEPVTKFLN
ncbi:MAG: hypothetical protein AAFZ15_23875 [Bacteroidota bacterium]